MAQISHRKILHRRPFLAGCMIPRCWFLCNGGMLDQFACLKNTCEKINIGLAHRYECKLRHNQGQSISPDMKKLNEKIPVEGGWIARSAATGRFVEAGTSKGVSKASAKTQAVVKEASSKRSSALKRLADR